MSNIIEMVLFIVPIAAIIFLYQKSEKEESYLFLKIAGYTLLGAFTFSINGFKLPLGFVLFLLFFRNISKNTVVKKRAVYIGFIVFLLSVILPFIETKLYEWPRKVELQDTNFFSGRMVDEWENIKEELEINADYGVEITHFRTVISHKGEFKHLEMSLVEHGYPNVIYYTFNLLADGKSLEVKREKVIEEMNWGGLDYHEANYIFANIDLITEPMFNHKEIKYYELQTDGQRINYAVEDQTKFRVHSGGVEKIENHQLPVNGILMEVCGTRGSIDENGFMFECDTREHFLMD